MKISSKGQVTVPPQWRKKYGLLPNADVDCVPLKDGLLLRKAERASRGDKLAKSLEAGERWKGKSDDVLRQTRSEV